ncbi:MAG TPA: hypothetical protein VLW85_07150, partial [Myxococcales bacterium]|nr:hypothetical protein [Myxococcales bacterium]
MPESANASNVIGVSLEQILWRAMDRWNEEPPALCNADEFAAHMESLFEDEVPAEAWVERFFEGAETYHHEPADMAEAIVRATTQRLHVYEFDVGHAEYVVVEDEKKTVVVSSFGQFVMENDDHVRRAVQSAIIPQARLDRTAPGPKAYLVKSGGEVVALDPSKMARSLQYLAVQQVSAPAVMRPEARLAPFQPRKRRLTPEREAAVLRQDPRARQPAPLPPPRKSAAGEQPPRPSPAARTALFVVMPDGQLMRAEIGAAARWSRMIKAGAPAQAAEVTGAQRITIRAGNVVAIVNRAGIGTASPGAVAEQSLQRGRAIAAVRADAAPVRVLRDDQLEQVLARGAQVVPGLQQGNRFWVQPEKAFKPDGKTLGDDAPEQPVTAGRPVRLGEITGDPWADWALTGGGELPPSAMAALRGRTMHALRAALDRPDVDDVSIPPDLVDRVRGVQGSELPLVGAPVIGFRAPDGSVLVARPQGAIRLAAVGRPDAGLLQPIDLQLPPPGAVDEMVPRTGAVPATALAALQMALEKTAAAGGYKLPPMTITSALDALDAGGAMQLDDDDSRRFGVRLAGTPLLGGQDGTTAQLVLSMPFPNDGEIHVGSDLSDALQAYLATPMVSVSPPPGALAAGAGLGAAAGGLLINLRGGQQSLDQDGNPIDWGDLHQRAKSQARDAVITLDIDEVQPLLAAGPAAKLPFLLRRALAETDWAPAPGMPVPAPIRTFALSGPFDQQQPGLDIVPPPQEMRRPNPGEDEIVIPLPLWAEMGRGRLTDTEQIMASPLASSGYTPPLGVYRLVVPDGLPV